MNNLTLIIVIILLIIFSNWLAGFLNSNFFSKKYETKESLNYLSSNNLKLVKLIRPTEKLQIKSNVLTDNRSLLRKIYSTRQLHVLIIESKKDYRQNVLWVELLKQWNVKPSKTRVLNYYQETNDELISNLL